MRIGTVFGIGAAAALACLLTASCGGNSSSDNGFPADDGSDSDGGEAGTGSGGGGGFGTPTASDASSTACVGLQCQQQTCTNGGQTTVTGTVYAPNGTLPLYNVILYVPNSTVAPLTQGITCDQCGTVASGDPVVTTLSNPDGTFKLTNVPVGKNIPLVMQLGKWRRQIVIPEVASCIETPLTDHDQTRLPKTQKEGNMPHIALTTGALDNLGCMLPKVGIDPSEFGTGADGYNKAVNVFAGFGGKGPSGTTSATGFWNNATQLATYDMVLLSCEGNEYAGNGGTKNAASFQAMTNYLTAGGRIFTTDFMYTWYKDSPDTGIKGVSSIPGGAPGEGDYLGPQDGPGDPLDLDTTFPKGLALSNWLKTSFPSSPTVSNNQVEMDIVFGNIASTDTSKAQIWARSQNVGGGTFPRVQTVNVPVGASTDKQCGKGVHIDAHVDNPGVPNSDSVTNAYPGGCTHPLKEGEALLAFFFFDLAACIQNDSQPPPPPPPGVK